MKQPEEKCLELMLESLELSKSLFNDELNQLPELENDGCDKKELNKFETEFKNVLNSIENLKKQILLLQEKE